MAKHFAHHMSDEDALMWNIEKDPILRSTIVAVAIFDRPPDWDRLRRRIERTTVLVPRFRQHALSPPLRIAPPRWAVEPEFDLDFHLRRVRLATPGSMRTLLDTVQPLAMTSFDRARPLWEFTLIEGLDGPYGERAAFSMKVHHSVTDGVGGMELLAHMIDVERDAPEPSATGLPPAPAPEPMGTRALVRDSLGHTTRRMLGMAQRLPGVATRSAVGAMLDPVGAIADAARTTSSVARTIAPATAPMSPIMVARGLGRHLDVTEVSLDDVKRVAKTTEASVNDVFVAAITGGVRLYHEEHGAAPEALRMTLPISLRQRGDDAVGNRFAPARFPVPTNIDDPRERIQAIRRLVKNWRAEPALQMTSGLALVLNRLPTATTTALFGGMLKCCDFVTTNVPGAPVPVFSAGAEVERLFAFAPPSGAAFNVALISHCDTCCIGIVIDTTAVPDPEVLVGCLTRGFGEVLALA